MSTALDVAVVIARLLGYIWFGFMIWHWFACPITRKRLVRIRRIEKLTGVKPVVNCDFNGVPSKRAK